MALSSADGERKTLLVETASAQGSRVEKKIDASEDREILGYKLQIHGQDLTLDSEVTAWAFTGNDPRGGADNISDNEQFYEETSVEIYTDSTNGHSGNVQFGNGQYVDVSDEPYSWDRHVTLTVKCDEALNNDTAHAKLIVHYREV